MRRPRETERLAAVIDDRDAELRQVIHAPRKPEDGYRDNGPCALGQHATNCTDVKHPVRANVTQHRGRPTGSHRLKHRCTDIGRDDHLVTSMHIEREQRQDQRAGATRSKRHTHGATLVLQCLGELCRRRSLCEPAALQACQHGIAIIVLYRGCRMRDVFRKRPPARHDRGYFRTGGHRAYREQCTDGTTTLLESA